MSEIKRVYQNSTELMNLAGLPFYMADVVDACLYGRLNLFLQGDTGSGKTQLARDVMDYFPNKSMFVLGRNDMDTRELFQRMNLGRFNQKPLHNLEPLVDIDTGDINYYYPIFKNGIFTQTKLSSSQTEVVRKSLEKLAGTTEDIRELTSKVDTRLFVTDELPNCVPAIRAQLFNLYDGFIELGGKAYPFGKYFVIEKEGGSLEFLEAGVSIETLQSLRGSGARIMSDTYSVGIATGNVGQKFTESNNDLGRALKDRMHVILDTDYFKPTAWDTFSILSSNTNPRVDFGAEQNGDLEKRILKIHQAVVSVEIPFEKLVLVNYLIHGLDYVNIDGRETTKTKMKDAWPNAITNHGIGSDEALIFPISPRAAKSILRLSQAFDYISKEKGASDEEVKGYYFDSVMQAFKFVGAYSGILNDLAVRENYANDKYSAIDAIIQASRTQYDSHLEDISAGLYMISQGSKSQKVLDSSNGRWGFMRNFLERAVEQNSGVIK